MARDGPEPPARARLDPRRRRPLEATAVHDRPRPHRPESAPPPGGPPPGWGPYPPPPPSGGPNGRTVAIVLGVLGVAGVAFVGLERARSQAYRDCEVQERLEETTGTSSGATVTALPDDPLTPGVTYQIDLQPGDPLTEYEFTVIVGQQRAHLDFCGCADLGLDGQRAIAQAVARDLAAAQGLPNPG
jgi:hypothetical protein